MTSDYFLKFTLSKILTTIELITSLFLFVRLVFAIHIEFCFGEIYICITLHNYSTVHTVQCLPTMYSTVQY